MATQVLQCGGVLVYQLLCGREIAAKSRMPLMDNYCYLVVNTHDRTGIAIDAAWDVDGIYELAARLGVKIKGCIYTHFHFDHCGGKVDPMFTRGQDVNLPGAKEIHDRGGRIWAGKGDEDEIRKQCSIETVEAMQDGFVLDCGDLVLHILHTPGHTPGSICIFAAPQCLSPRNALGDSPLKERQTKAEAGLLITGDTLFVGSCGRTDFPGSSEEQMMRSLARLSLMDPAVVVLPGHAYSPEPFTTIGTERSSNMAVRQGLSRVPKPPALPPCAACGVNGVCGPKGFKIGRKVRIKGLLSEQGQRMNGEAGVVQRFNDEKERYEVRLLEDQGIKVLKADNLEVPSSSQEQQSPGGAAEGGVLPESAL